MVKKHFNWDHRCWNPHSVFYMNGHPVSTCYTICDRLELQPSSASDCTLKSSGERCSCRNQIETLQLIVLLTKQLLPAFSSFSLLSSVSVLLSFGFWLPFFIEESADEVPSLWDGCISQSSPEKQEKKYVYEWRGDFFYRKWLMWLWRLRSLTIFHLQAGDTGKPSVWFSLNLEAWEPEGHWF